MGTFELERTLKAHLFQLSSSVVFHSSALCPCACQDLTPDYSMESHQRDHENYVACSRNRRRRAKALLDFERHDDDELGFRKNDIITVCQPRGEAPGHDRAVQLVWDSTLPLLWGNKGGDELRAQLGVRSEAAAWG